MPDFAAGDLRLSLDPDAGAAITSFDLGAGTARVPVIVAAAPGGRDSGGSALFPMAPFANRVRNNRLVVAGRERLLGPNTADPLCLHGWAWQRRWRVDRLAPERCVLSLDLREHGYDLALAYEIALSSAGLSLGLHARNRGPETVPVGLGFHPYFPRHDDTRIHFAAGSIWQDGPGHLPLGRAAIPEAGDFSRGRALPRDWRNDCYSGWTGAALVEQPGLGYDLTLRATGADVLMVYADPGLSRFALEPQSHVSGETHTGPHGLSELRSGRKTSITLEMRVCPRGGGPA